MTNVPGRFVVLPVSMGLGDTVARLKELRLAII